MIHGLAQGPIAALNVLSELERIASFLSVL
jgi:hypothetical protein